MTQYRRSLTPGSTYFFTVNLANRSGALLTTHIDILREAVAAVKTAHPFAINAMVILPDHLHAVWTLPPDDAGYALRWRLIKTRFSRAMPRIEGRSHSRMAKGERGIWQRRYWEHEIRDAIDMQRHMDYIHINPLKHGYVAHAADWPYSSIHRFIERGDLPRDWAWACEEIGMGERA